MISAQAGLEGSRAYAVRNIRAELSPILAHSRLAHGAIGSPAALALLDQRQNRGNHIFEFRDLADDRRRGQPRLPRRVLDQGVLHPFETVEQGSEIGRSVVHVTTLGQAVLPSANYAVHRPRSTG